MIITKRLVSCLVFACLLATPAAGQTVYLAFGDSITNGVGFDDCACQCPEECGFAARLEGLLEQAGFSAEVENHGLGGEKTDGGLTRIDEVLAGGGDVLILMEGSNDISRGISIETTLFNLREMARKASARGLPTIHATVIPRIPTAPSDAENRITRRLNWGIREMAYFQGRRLADPYEVFDNTADVFARLYHQGTGDPVGHPNSQGYDVLADVFFDVIVGNDEVPPVPGGVEPFDAENRVPANSAIRLRLYDFGTGIDLGATELLVDGQPVPASVLGDTAIADFTYQPPAPLSGVVTVGYRTQDLAAPANAITKQISRFVIAGTQFLTGDLDNDGRVDGADLVDFALHFGARRGTPRYRDYMDFTGDGAIDGADLALLAANFGRSIG